MLLLLEGEVTIENVALSRDMPEPSPCWAPAA
jgi:hypothetical protein